MKFIKYLLFLILIGIVALAVYIAVQPNSYDVNRSRVINAPASVIYNNAIDFKTWPDWMARAEKNPDLAIKMGKKSEGIGGSFSWEEEDGKGQMRTLSANPHTTIEQELQFDDFAPSTVYWNFKPAEVGTEVTWGMKSDNTPFMLKAMAILKGGMDKLFAPDYERGLERLDSLTVAQIQVYDIKVDGLTEHSGGFYLYKTVSCRTSEVRDKMHQLFTELGQFTAENNITPAGKFYTYFHKWDDENDTTMFSCCVPTTDRVILPEGDVLTGQIPSFKAVKTTLKGNYDNTEEAWDKAMQYVENAQMEYSDDNIMLESYPVNPGDTPNPAEWVTEIYLGVK